MKSYREFTKPWQPLEHNFFFVLELRGIRHKARIFSGGEVAVFSAKRWDRRNRAALIEPATPCYDAQVVRPYQVSNPLRLTVLTSKSGDYIKYRQNDTK